MAGPELTHAALRLSAYRLLGYERRAAAAEAAVARHRQGQLQRDAALPLAVLAMIER